MPRHPTSLVLFHCLFSEEGLSDPVTHAIETPAYTSLPLLYAICAIDEGSRPERMVSGMLIKTNFGHGSPDFLDGMSAAFHVIAPLRARMHSEVSLLAAPVLAESAEPLSEAQSLSVLGELWSEHYTLQVISRFSLSGCNAGGVHRR